MGYIVDIICCLIIYLILFDFKKGYVIVLCCKVCIPEVVRFGIPSFSINVHDLFVLMLMISFILSGQFKKKVIPNRLKKVVAIYIVSSFMLIFLSSSYVPYAYQLSCFVKMFLLQEQTLILLGFWAFNGLESEKSIYVLFSFSIICGIYGIITYFLEFNPIVQGASLMYLNEEDRFAEFIHDSRGGLSGRVSGTMQHPLSWGQFWTVLLAFYFLIRKHVYNFFGILLLFIGVINIFLSGSRSAFIGLIVLIVFLLLYVGLSKKYFIYSCVILILGLFVLSGSDLLSKKQNSFIFSAVFFWNQDYSNRADVKGSSVQMRQSQFESAIDLVGIHLMTGLGYEYRSYRATKGFDGDDDGTKGLESILLKKTVEQGLVGLGIFFYVFVMLYLCLRRYFTHENKKLYIAYFFSYLLSILFTGIQGSSWIFFVALLIWALNLSRLEMIQNLMYFLKSRKIIIR